jgi:hypothetical protein
LGGVERFGVSKELVLFWNVLGLAWDGVLVFLALMLDQESD